MRCRSPLPWAKRFLLRGLDATPTGCPTSSRLTSRLLALFLAVCISCTFAANTQSRQVLQQASVMGFRHYEGKQVWDSLRVGQPLKLVREADNPHDNQAIRVEWEGHKLGYVPRADNVDLARLMDNGSAIEARITKLEKSRRPNNRVQFEIYLAR